MSFKFTNSASAALASSLTSSATSLTVTTGLGALFPSLVSGEYFTAALADSTGNVEFVTVTSRVGDVMTIIRAQEGSTAHAFSSGDRIELRLTSAVLANFSQLNRAETYTGEKTFSGQVHFQGGGSFNDTGISGNPTWTGDHSFIGDPVFTGTVTFSGIQHFTGDATLTGSIYLNGTTNRATNLIIGQHEAFLYESAANEVTLRTGATGSFKYTTFGANGSVAAQGDITTSGNITASGDVTAFSDERLKTDWCYLQSGFVEQLAQVLSGSFYRTDIGKRQIGVGAQSLQKILPLAILEESDGFLSVNYGAAAMVSCVELAKDIVALKAEVAALKGV